MLSRTVGGCTSRTVALYRTVLAALVATLGDDSSACTTLAVQGYLSALRARVRATTAHLHFSKLRAFFRWCTEAGVLPENPLRGAAMKVPKTLPRVPEDAHVRRLLQTCPETFQGRRNRALVALLADSGLRISEALRLRIETCASAKGLPLCAGKGQKDGVGFFGRRQRTVRRPQYPRRR